MSSVADPPRTRHTARDAVLCILVAAAVLVSCAGDSVSRQGREMKPGAARTVVLAVGEPTGWVADRLPFAPVADQVTGWLSADDDLGSDDGTFSAGPAAGGGATAVPAAAFDPQDLGERTPKASLGRVLVTGDSMSMPLDAELARTLAKRGVPVARDPHIGTGISKTDLVDWGKLAIKQSRAEGADAVVMFLGANEGFPMETKREEVECCGPEWAAEYATRARAMMATYLNGGAHRVVWLALPLPRDTRRARISHAVNRAVRVAAGGFGAQVEVLAIDDVFTPGGRYRDALEVGGREQVVRRADGIHLNDVGARLATTHVLRALERDFSFS